MIRILGAIAGMNNTVGQPLMGQTEGKQRCFSLQRLLPQLTGPMFIQSGQFIGHRHGGLQQSYRRHLSNEREKTIKGATDQDKQWVVSESLQTVVVVGKKINIAE
jgi:hypothetical protein